MLHHTKKSFIGTTALAGAIGFVLAGCGGNKEADKPTPAQTESVATQNQVDRIKNDPNMPAEAKTAALNAIQQNQKSGTYLKQSAEKQGGAK